MTMIPLHLLLACAGKPVDVDTAPVDADTDTDTDTDADADTGTYTFNGTVPDTTIPVPEFTAQNMDGSLRSKADLIGHPTVVWFYPAAMTSG